MQYAPIAPHNSRASLQDELDSIPGDKLFDIAHYSCYLSDYGSIPTIINEMGVCREETFRAVGEGTGLPIDLDEYDTRYKHIHLWDTETGELIGGYRLGFGPEVLYSKGIRGLYTDRFFHYDKELEPILSQSIELGRSFVVGSHQKKAMPLNLLLKGVFYTVIRHPEIRYLLGPASVSSWYPPLYSTMICDYMQSTRLAPDLAAHVHPNCPFVPDWGDFDRESIVDSYARPETFDHMMMKRSGGEFRMPTMFKKYAQLGCKLLCFNVDHAFNDSLDALIVVDMLGLTRDAVDGFTHEIEDKGAVYARFGL